MKFKRLIGITIPVVSLIVGGALLSTGSESNKAPVATEAADYSISARDFVVNQDGSITATFTPYKSDLDMEGWLLCLLTDKPDYNLDSRKLVYSDDTHPYSYSNCAHYFYTQNVATTGRISITWAANEGDQKGNWHSTSFVGASGSTLADCFAAQDWHIVVGPRHYRGSWKTSEEIGAGKDHIWENCDYYVGRKKALVNGVDGQTYIDCTSLSDWGKNAKLAVYFWDNNSHIGWSGFATASGHDNIYLAQYSLDFVPTGMKAARLNPEYDTPDWSHKYNQGNNVSFYEAGVIGIVGWDPGEDYENSWAYAMATVDFSVSDKVTLDFLKRNASNHSENYNQRFPLAVGQVFNVGFGGSSYGNFKINASLASCFDTTSVSGKLTVLTTGIYALYFDTDAHSLYITTTALAEADEWAEPFLGDGCTYTKNNWDSEQNKYNDLSDEAKQVLKDTPHYGPNEQIEGWVNKAMQRYDFLVQFFGYGDYISRSGKWTPNNANEAMKIFSSDNAATTLTVIVTASLCVAAIGALFIVKKKRVSK